MQHEPIEIASTILGSRDVCVDLRISGERPGFLEAVDLTRFSRLPVFVTTSNCGVRPTGTQAFEEPRQFLPEMARIRFLLKCVEQNRFAVGG